MGVNFVFAQRRLHKGKTKYEESYADNNSSNYKSDSSNCFLSVSLASLLVEVDIEVKIIDKF